jgi:hypothetical protein
MTTVAQLADRCQLALSDSGAGTWPQATVEDWVCDAVREYSQHFPRILTTHVDTIGGTPDHYTLLPEDFLEIVSVEFPLGEDPPVYLQHRSMHHPEFWDRDGYYDVLRSDQIYSALDTDTYNKIVWSRVPLATEGYKIRYQAAHSATSASDPITIRTDHQPILVLFVIWRALKERQAKEAANPDTTSRYLNQLVYAATQAEQEYRRALDRAINSRSDSGWAGPWRADIYDPIY